MESPDVIVMFQAKNFHETLLKKVKLLYKIKKEELISGNILLNISRVIIYSIFFENLSILLLGNSKLENNIFS